jgi:hypothetical protein
MSSTTPGVVGEVLPEVLEVIVQCLLVPPPVPRIGVRKVVGGISHEISLHEKL